MSEAGSLVLHVGNPARLTSASADAADRCVRNLDGWDAAVSEIHSWPEYRVEPLWSLPSLARRLRVRQVSYKDESARYGPELGSFKALGAPYTVFTVVRDAVRAATGREVTAADLRSGEFRSITDQVTVCVATDGNQGRGLAYGARTFGCRCVTYGGLWLCRPGASMP